MKYIIVGDTHIRKMPPVFRNRNFYDELCNKLRQIKILSEKHSAEVIVLGDFFDNAIQSDLEQIISDNINSIKGWYTLIGNHDTKNIIGSLYNTSLGILQNTGIIKIAKNTNISDIFHYYNRNDYGKFTDKKYAFIHDYILPEGVNVMYEHKKCVGNNYKYVFIGHYHLPFDILSGCTRFINPGSLMRLTADEIKLNRKPEVLLLDTETDELIHIPLQSADLSDIINTGYIEQKENKFESKFVDLLINT